PVYIFASNRPFQYLHSFPTRRSSDLEIALVQDVPRTATVRPLTDCSLLALDRDEFIAAVTGHAPSREAADAVISTRLGTLRAGADRKSTRLNSSHVKTSYAVFCLKKK